MIEIDGRNLALPDIVAVADGEGVVLAPEAVARLAASQESAVATSLNRPVYGRSTGVGANRGVTLSKNDGDDTHGLQLLRSHAVDSGRPLDRRTVRAMLVVRLSQLAAGASGINPAIAVALAELINSDVVPEIREFGGIGTADLQALSGTALTMLGEREPLGGGGVRRFVESWATADALPFISSSALTIAQAVLAHEELSRLLDNAQSVAALSFVAMSGNVEALSPAVAAAADTPAVAKAANTFYELVQGSGQPARIQDPYCLRTLPQIFGSQIEELESLGTLLCRLVTAGNENPLVHGSLSDGSNDVAHHGLFQMTNLARRADALQLAIGAACATHLRRIDLLCDPKYTGLHPFLAEDGTGQSGVMMLEYVAAAAVGRIRANTQPASLQTVVLSLGAEEDASFASLAAAQLQSTVRALATVTGVELVCAARALRLQGRRAEEFASHKLRSMMTAGYGLPSDVTDRDLRGDVEQANRIVLATH
ncbi:aromatic amino acid lyase [Paenarthrobacter nitroguajacolicus]|uniref:aromatic amino acid lyase n=1 Tax=Paenarthrobacter nitroguajacolicus TaxID=211146 RepID=UPI00248CDC0F|nr:aromatic amino acid lyase [Paenarthrobacter nitroguajacolicus]MDI2035515.1 Histidine ammonia-lyase [Paenarthrobacter nitroguajacolicus]